MMDGLYITKYKRLILMFSLGFLLILLFSLILYIIVVYSFTIPFVWIAQISIKCPVSRNIDDLTFSDATFALMGLSFFILGAYYGMILDACYFKGSHRTINQTSLKKMFIRLVISLMIIFVTYIIPVSFISNEHNTLTVFFCKYMMPSFISSFYLFGLSKVLNAKLNLN
jgi:hypothetical protein